MRRCKVEAFLRARMSPNSADQYLSQLKKLEEEYFFLDLDFVVSTANSYSNALKYFDELFNSGKLLSSQRSNYKSYLKEYRAYYLFDRSHPDWEKEVYMSSHYRKKPSANLQRLNLDDYYNLVPSGVAGYGISVRDISSDSFAVRGLDAIVAYEANKICDKLEKFLGGNVNIMPAIYLSDEMQEETHLRGDAELVSDIKAVLSESKSPVAVALEGLISSINPIASIKEFIKSHESASAGYDAELAETLSRIKQILESDWYSYITGGEYFGRHKVINLYYRGYDASSPEKFMAALRAILAHELFHAYHHACIGWVFYESDCIYKGKYGSSVLSDINSASAEGNRNETNDCSDERDEDRERRPKISDNRPDKKTITVEAFDRYDIVRESLADFYSMYDGLDDSNPLWSIHNYKKSSLGAARDKYNWWVENLPVGLCYAYALYYMKSPYNQPDMPFSVNQPDYINYGVIEHFIKIFKDSYISLEQALKALLDRRF